MTNIWAIIPARGGSKGLPRKNILPLAGMPLIAHSIRAARECTRISRCIVSTDCSDIAEIARQYGSGVMMRPPALAQDTSLSRDVVRHVLAEYAAAGETPDAFALLQPTSPLRTSDHLTDCLTSFLEGNYLSAVSVTECEHHPYKSFVQTAHGILPTHELEDIESPRQLLPKAFRPNGGIFLANTQSFLEQNRFFLDPVFLFPMDRDSSIDIDTAIDLQAAENILKVKI
jgi:CMP-N-acetylneuraminic acid synthetase